MTEKNIERQTEVREALCNDFNETAISILRTDAASCEAIQNVILQDLFENPDKIISGGNLLTTWLKLQSAKKSALEALKKKFDSKEKPKGLAELVQELGDAD